MSLIARINKPSIVKAVRAFSWLTIDRAGQVITTLTVSALLARGAGVESYGQWQVALSLLFMLATLSNFASNDVTIPLVIAKGAEGKSVISAALKLRFLAALFNIGLGILLALFWPGTSTLLVILILPILFREPVIAVMMWFMATGNIRPYALISISTLVIRLFCTIVIYLAGKPLYWYVIPLLIENIFFVGLLLHEAKKEKIGLFQKVPTEFLRSMAHLSGWGWLAAVASLAIMRADRLLLSTLVPADSLGLYSAAAQINDNWYYLGILMVGGLAPTLIYRAHPGVIVRNTVMLTIAVLSICAMGAAFISFFSKEIILIIFGKAFDATADILKITTWTTALIPIDMILSLPLLHFRKIKWVAIKNICILLGVITIAYFLFPRFGIFSPAVALATGYLTSIILTCIKIRTLRVEDER
jgi:O-antigen/teichoic acid export membrane protein